MAKEKRPESEHNNYVVANAQSDMLNHLEPTDSTEESAVEPKFDTEIISKLLDKMTDAEKESLLYRLIKESIGESENVIIVKKFSNDSYFVKEDTVSSKKGQTVAGLLSQISDDYASLSLKISDINHDFRMEIAKHLAPALNSHIREHFKHKTYEQKKILCEWLNEEIKHLGLAVQCPKTKLPAQIKADPGNYPDIGRYQFQVSSGSGKPRRTCSMDALPEFTLTDRDAIGMRSERWADKVASSKDLGPREV